ncbi:hypothetical protein ACT7C1_15890 [Bacillus paranthracis]
MGFGFGGGCGCNDHRELPKRKEQIITENNDSNPGLLQFLRTLARVFLPKPPKWGNKFMLFGRYTPCQKVHFMT